MNNFETLDGAGLKDWLGSWMKTNHSGGKIRGREIGCRALKNSTQTSSADNESEPEQLFVLAEVTLKLAHLPLTEAAWCVLPDTIVFNILKFCLLLCITFNNWWKKWGVSSAGSSQASPACRWGEGERQNEWVCSLELLSWVWTSLHVEVFLRAQSSNKTAMSRRLKLHLTHVYLELHSNVSISLKRPINVFSWIQRGEYWNHLYSQKVHVCLLFWLRARG